MKAKFYITGLFLTITLLFIGNFNSQAQDLGKYEALYVYNFIKYIQWPQTGEDFVIGVYGAGSINSELNTMIKTKGDGKLKYKSIKSSSDLDGCSIIFLTRAENPHLSEILAKTEGKSVLVVTESEDSAKRGAGISFFLDQDRLKFTINKSVVESKNMKVSSSLMNLAKVI